MKRAEYEAVGHDAVEICLNDCMHENQATVCTAILVMLNSLSGDGEISKQARMGASVALADTVMRGLSAILADGEA